MDLFQIILRNYKIQEYRQRLTYKVTTAPAAEPLTLAEAKLHLKMDGISADDDLITSLIIAARQYAENYCNRGFITQTITQVYNRFPEFDGILRLAVSPLVSVTSVVYKDENGDDQTWAGANYVVDNYTEPGEISLANSKIYPTTLNQKNAITVVYQAGYGGSADVPSAVKQAMLLLIGHFYVNREDTVSEKRTAAERLLGFYRVKRY
jgi:uncharacterized phiE125 gp8 family phage protein